jgi:hypothetical protein
VANLDDLYVLCRKMDDALNRFAIAQIRTSEVHDGCPRDYFVDGG